MKRPRILIYRPSQKKYANYKAMRLIGSTIYASVALRKTALALKRGTISKEEAANKIVELTSLVVSNATKSVNNYNEAFQAAIDGRMNLTQAMILQSQPVPKYPPGGQHNGGPAIVGEQGEAVILKISSSTPIINIPAGMKVMINRQ